MTTHSPWNKFPKNWNELSQILQKIGTSIGLHTHVKADVTDFAHKTTHQHSGADEVSTATAAANSIPKADGAGKLDTWISDASEAVKGKVELATSAETTAGLAVQASDTRLSDARTPKAHKTTHVTGGDDIIAEAVAGVSNGLLSAADKTKLDDAVIKTQTSPQTFVSGIPLLEETRVIDQLHELVDKAYVDQAVTALGMRFYMTNDASGVESYYLTAMTDPVAFNQVYAGLVNAQLIVGFISPVGAVFSKMLAGIYDWNVFMAKTAGTKSLRVYWTLVERTSGGSETVIGTSSQSDLIGTKARFRVPLTLSNDYTPASGSRIIGKLYAVVGASGSAPALTLYGGGTDDSHWETPTNKEILDTIYAALVHATRHQHGGADEVSTATAAANAIPKADGSGKLDTWISDASETVKGKVELATSSETTAGLAVQASDTRLSNERVPTAAGIAAKINAATAKSPLVDADEFGIADSEATYGLKKTLWSVVKSTLKTYFDGLYAALVHATRHQSGGADSIKLDDLAAPDDNDDLNVSTTKHGLFPKLSAPASGWRLYGLANGETAITAKPLTAAGVDMVQAANAAAQTALLTQASTTAKGLAPQLTAPAAGLRNVMGIDNTETALTAKALFDATVPAALGTAAAGTAMAAARRDHVHIMPKLDGVTAPDDNTALDAGTAKHGLLLKATAPAAGLRNVVAIDNGETVYKNAALFDATVPEATGVAATGSAMTAARRDHVHASAASGDFALSAAFTWFVG